MNLTQNNSLIRAILAIVFTISLNLGWGQFGPKNEITTNGIAGEYMVVEDLDNDGLLDFVCINYGEVVWYKNLGGGIYSDRLVITRNIIGGQTVFTSDLDNDGLTDVLSASENDSKIAWYKNLGGGVFTDALLISTNALSAQCVAASDIDGDGDLDVISGSKSDSKISWYENLGSGIFGTENIISTNVLMIVWLIAADIDNDSDIDIISSSYGDDLVAWFENDGLGNFTTAQIITNSLTDPFKICSGDMDSDGLIDIITTSLSDDRVDWFKNLGGGSFSGPNSVSSTIQTPYSIYVKDIDNDSDSDIVCINFTGNSVFLYENNGSGIFIPPVTQFSYPPAGVAVSIDDIDNDLDQDIISYFTSGQIHININDGSNNFTEEIEVTSSEYGVIQFYCADLDSNGYEDIVIGANFDNKLSVYFNNGNSTFAEQYVISDSALDIQSIYGSDLDGDGDIDIVTGTKGDNTVSWYENIGLGIFSNPNLISASAYGVCSVYSSDLDNDGDQDIISASQADNKIAYYENLGGGVFDVQTVITNSYNLPIAISASDIDGDSLPDIVFGTSYELVWLKNLGGNTFGQDSIISATLLGAKKIQIVDIDQDGDNDVLSATSYSDKISVHENLGGGSFALEIVLTDMIYAASSVNSGDLNNDGALDVIATSLNDDKALFFIQNDSLSFSQEYPITYLSLDYSSTNAFPIDVDEDGDLDIVLGCGKIMWHENLTYHPYNILGNIYLDQNQNGIKDSSEFGLDLAQILSVPVNSSAMTTMNGNYYMYVDNNLFGTYNIFPDTSDLWSITTDSSFYTVVVDSSFSIVDSLDFGIYPSNLKDSINCELTGGPAECFNYNNYWISINNIGSTIPSGKVHLNLHGSISYISSSTPPDSIIGNNIYWTYDSLWFFDQNMIHVTVAMPGISSFGIPLKSYITCTVDSSGQEVFSDVDSLTQYILCAYDPNDKLVDPTGIDSMGYIPQDTEFLEYTVRFQNTGNDTAETVIIVDEISNYLDFNSLEILGYSHPLQVQLDYNGTINFIFDNIMLPDSNVNELESHGFVKFKLNLIDSIPKGHSIYNTANIYFDYNPAIVTNTTINTIFDCVDLFYEYSVTSVDCEGDTIFVNTGSDNSQTTYYWYVQGSSPIINSSPYWHIDTSGVFTVNVQLNNNICFVDSTFEFETFDKFIIDLGSFDICDNDSILIFGQYESVSGFYYDSLQANSGCDSILVKELIVYQQYFENIGANQICSGDSLQIFGIYQNTAGFYYDTLSTVYGCDSILITELFVNPVYSVNQGSSWICENDSLLVYGQFISTPGIYYDSLQTVLGCDSIINFSLYTWNLPSVNLSPITDDTLCNYSAIIALNSSPTGGIYSGPGISGNQFDPSSSGLGQHTIYYSYTDGNGCTGTDSAQIFVSECLGLEAYENLTITLFPNPFSDYTSIYFNENLNGELDLILYDASGKIVYQKSKLSGNHAVIERANLKAGIYILSLVKNSDGAEVYNEKLIIE